MSCLLEDSSRLRGGKVRIHQSMCIYLVLLYSNIFAVPSYPQGPARTIAPTSPTISKMNPNTNEVAAAFADNEAQNQQ